MRSVERAVRYEIQRQAAILADGGTKAESTTALSAGAWYHVAVTWDGTTLRLFINGTQEYSTTAWSISDTSADLNIGRSPEYTARLWDGLVDDVRIWNYGRTAADITANKDAEVPCASLGLIAYWKWNGDGTDCTGSALTLTPQNAPAYTADVPFN